MVDTRARDLPGRGAIGIVNTIEIGEWGDINQDGNLDIVVDYGYMGRAADVQRQTHIWQIEQDGQLVDLTAEIYDTYHLVPSNIQDLNDDGVLELYVEDNRGEWYPKGHAYISSFKIYAWQGDQVQDISASFLDWYDERILEDSESIKDSYDDEIDFSVLEEVLGKAFRLLLDYENSGRRDEGWAVYWELADPENWEHIGQPLAEYLNEWREHHKAQYEAGEPFSQ